ncbi:MAG: UDP-glucose/GDP-mannose dehydrogenase family, UDP binding domain [Methanomassiliicoccales archaeon PtaU1.Bin030]|nr:MAG: UDP-glucose/GDP-mannose dehydrogenase family, UDP binding domain [Methanomassiliicoccales archaeon PtaU1.Bin030]
MKVYDPLAQSIKIDGATLESERSVEEVLTWADCAILLTAHAKLREQLHAVMPTIDRTDFVFVDTRNVIKDKVNGFRGITVKLGSTKER